MKVFNKNIEILGDSEGFIILECPYCKSEFKVSADDLQSRGDIYFELFCPYCGLSKEIKYFYTKDIKSKSTRIKKDIDKNKVNTNQSHGKVDSVLGISNLYNNGLKLSSSKSLDMSFSNMEKQLEERKEIYKIKIDNKKLKNINVSRLKNKNLKENVYECDVCGLSQKLLCDGETIVYCAYCGVSLI